MDQIKKDTQFLMENYIIDYSLLVGIHILDVETTSNRVNILETPLKVLKNKLSSPWSPGMQLNTHQDKNTSNELLPDLKFKESKSLDEKRKNLSINLDDDEKGNISEYSMYDMDINYSENESVYDVRKSTANLHVGQHPFKDVNRLFLN
jgi:hypothetical protein